MTERSVFWHLFREHRLLAFVVQYLERIESGSEPAPRRIADVIEAARSFDRRSHAGEEGPT